MPQLLVVAVGWAPGVESVTLTVKEKGPAVVGVPVMAPVVVFSVSPPGKDQRRVGNVYRSRPPPNLYAELYGTPIVPAVIEAHSAVIVGGAIVMPQLLVGVVA